MIKIGSGLFVFIKEKRNGYKTKAKNRCTWFGCLFFR